MYKNDIFVVLEYDSSEEYVTRIFLLTKMTKELSKIFIEIMNKYERAECLYYWNKIAIDSRHDPQKSQ